uniref:SRCR domain-containing protein n=1 Tax=Apteryx owenii TaxID=8824 RepID=A0A8B9P3K5_APTOW
MHPGVPCNRPKGAPRDALQLPQGAHPGVHCNHPNVCTHGCLATIWTCAPWGACSCPMGAPVPECCAIPPEPFTVRLAGGPSRCVGRVEVRHEGRWGTVCDDDWELLDAAVVCRELGCGTALSAPSGAWFGEGSGPIWLNGLRCRGTEERLELCRHRGWRKHVCTHEEDASAVCSGGQHREGTVSVLRLWEHSPHSTVPGPQQCPCPSLWSRVPPSSPSPESKVSAQRWVARGPERLREGLVRMQKSRDPLQVECMGQETALAQCILQPGHGQSCPPDQLAGVECHGEHAWGLCGRIFPSGSIQFLGSTPAIYTEPFRLRLVSGPGQCAGRLEVWHNRRWGTVCDDGWTTVNSDVVCRELGCGVAQPVPRLPVDWPRFVSYGCGIHFRYDDCGWAVCCDIARAACCGWAVCYDTARAVRCGWAACCDIARAVCCGWVGL